MKRLLILLVFASAIVACKKTNITPGLFGRWELRRTSGGFRADSIYTAGNGNMYQFYSDSTYKKYAASKLSAQGTFHISRLPPNANGIIMIYFYHNSYGEPFQINNTTLTIGSSAADGLESDFQKVGN